MRNRRGRTIKKNRPKGQYVQTICQDRSESIWIRSFKKARRVVCPRNLRDKYSSGNQKMTIKSTMPGAEKGMRDIQLKKGASFQIKYQSPPHSVHCTNLTGYINGRMTPE